LRVRRELRGGGAQQREQGGAGSEGIHSDRRPSVDS
jgi:hypothetical protein